MILDFLPEITTKMEGSVNGESKSETSPKFFRFSLFSLFLNRFQIEKFVQF